MTCIKQRKGSSRILLVGIDPSLSSTGVIAIDGSCHVVFENLIKSNPTSIWRDGVRRIRTMALLLSNMLKALEPISLIGYEGYSYGSHYQSHQLGELGYAYRSVLIPYSAYIIPPKTVKKFITGRGNASKKDVQEAVNAYGYGVTENNLTDACALALFVRAMMDGGDKYFNKDQMEVVKKYSGRLG